MLTFLDLGQGDGQVDADRALADAALAGHDRDDVLDAGQERLGLDRVRPADHGPPGDVDRIGPDRDEGFPGVVLDLVLERASRVVSSIVSATADSRITTSLTMPRVMMSLPSSGSWTVRSASLIAPSVRAGMGDWGPSLRRTAGSF